MLFAGNQILDGLDAELAEARRLQAGNARVPIAGEIDRHIDRSESVRDDRREYLEHRAALLSARDVYHCGSLIGRRALVDRQLADAVSLMYGTRPPVRLGK